MALSARLGYGIATPPSAMVENSTTAPRCATHVSAAAAELSLLLRPDVAALDVVRQVAAAVCGYADVAQQHAAEVEAVTESLLARLDELTATLGTVSGDAAQQQTGMEPAFRAITAGLARDFAYIDGVGDALVSVRQAVAKQEAELTAAEALCFRQQRTSALSRIIGGAT